MNKKAKPTVWVLTYESNDYDQHGEYFSAVFEKKPDIEQILENTNTVCGTVKDQLLFALHVQKGGGRQLNENLWYNLDEVELK